jgi:addiction module HigA family antidote
MSREIEAARPRRAPTHPGALLREDVLPALGLKIAPAAREMRISRGHLTEVLKERKPISANVALRVERLTGTSAELLLRMQAAHDLWQQETRLAKELDLIHRVAA